MTLAGVCLALWKAAAHEHLGGEGKWRKNSSAPSLFCFVADRLYREHTTAYPGWDYVKDLSRLGRDLSRVVIVGEYTSPAPHTILATTFHVSPCMLVASAPLAGTRLQK